MVGGLRGRRVRKGRGDFPSLRTLWDRKSLDHWKITIESAKDIYYLSKTRCRWGKEGLIFVSVEEGFSRLEWYSSIIIREICHRLSV